MWEGPPGEGSGWRASQIKTCSKTKKYKKQMKKMHLLCNCFFVMFFANIVSAKQFLYILFSNETHVRFGVILFVDFFS